MKKRLISLIFILIAIITILCSTEVMASEMPKDNITVDISKQVISDVIELDLTSIQVLKDTKPKYLEYESDKYTVSQEWYYALPEPGIEGQYIPGTTKVEKFDNSFDTVYDCRITLTPKIGYKFESVGNVFEYGLNFIMATPKIIDEKYVIDIICKAEAEYKLTINNDEKTDATITMNGQAMNLGDSVTVHSHNKYEFIAEAKEGYVINKIEYKTKGETFAALAVDAKKHEFTIYPEDDVEIIITTEPTIELVEVTGGKNPISGETGDDLELKVPEYANYKIVDYYWNVNGKGEKAKGEVFSTSESYSLYVVISSPIRFSYSDMDNFNFLETCKITLDGNPAHVESVTKEDTNYYLILSFNYGYATLPQFFFIDNTDNQTYTRGQDTTLTFKIDTDYSLFKTYGTIYIDQEELSEEYYTHEEGSVVITLTEEYMNTLDLGEHFIDVFFEDKGFAFGLFNVVQGQNTPSGEGAGTPEDTAKPNDTTKPEDKTDTDDTTESDDKTSQNSTTNTTITNTDSAVEDTTNTANSNIVATGSTNPQTGDNIIFYVAILVISLVGIFATTKFKEDN